MGGPLLAIFAVEEVAHGLPSSLVRFLRSLAFVGVHTVLGCGVRGFRDAALWTAVCEAGFIGLQFELFLADGADFNGKRHFQAP